MSRKISQTPMNSRQHLSSSSSVTSSRSLPLGQAVRELPGQYLKVLTRPSVRTFVEEKGKESWGIVWIQLIGLAIVSAIILAVGVLISPPSLSSVTNTGGLSPETLQMIAVVFVAIFTLIITPVSFFAIGGIIFLIAKAFHGKGTYLEQIYATLLFGVPLVLVSDLLSLIPGVGGWLLYVPHIYSVVLMIFALIAVHGRGGTSTADPQTREPLSL